MKMTWKAQNLVLMFVGMINHLFMDYLKWLLGFWEVGNLVVWCVKLLPRWPLKSWFWIRKKIALLVLSLIIIWSEALMKALKWRNLPRGSIFCAIDILYLSFSMSLIRKYDVQMWSIDRWNWTCWCWYIGKTWETGSWLPAQSLYSQNYSGDYFSFSGFHV